MNQKNNVIIHAENVKKKFGDFYALKGVSMDVHEVPRFIWRRNNRYKLESRGPSESYKPSQKICD